MATRRFEPTPAWLHALDAPACLCHLLLVVEDNGQVVGWCRIFPKLEGDSAEIGLGLLPGYRDLGYGQELMSQAFSWVTGRGLAVSGS